MGKVEREARPATGRLAKRGRQLGRQPRRTAFHRLRSALHRAHLPLPANLRTMNAPSRAILSASIWAALLATSTAQLELKREPLVPAPAAPAAGAPKQAPAARQQILIGN